MPHLTTYHLFHRQTDPLPPGTVDDHTWLINNACSYSVVAVIEAPGAGEALQAAQCKAQARTLPRSTLIRAGNLLRETLPGDVLVSKNEAWIVDASQQVRKVSYKTNQNRKSFRQRSTINDLAWSPNGLILAIAENDRRVVLRIPENTNEYPPAYSRGEYAAAERLAWSPDGTRLASAGSRSEVHIWQPALWRSNGYTGSILICGTEEVVASYERIYRLVWTPDGSRIMAGREDGCLISWHASTGSGYRLQKRHAKAITALAFSPREEHLLLTASADTTVQIWDEVAEQEQVRFEHTASVTTAVWSPDGKVVASCEREDPTISLWSSQTGHLVARIPLSMYTIHDLTVYALAWSPDGALLAAGCDDGAVQLIDMALHQHIQTFWADATSRRTVKALAWSPDSTLLASGGTSAQVDIWQVCSPQAEKEEVAQRAQAEESFR